MFLFIGGIQPKKKWLGESDRSCPKCGQSRMQFCRIDHYLSLFFIPLVRVKTGLEFLACPECSAELFDENVSETSAREIFCRPKHVETCRACGGELRKNFNYCPYCGRELDLK